MIKASKYMGLVLGSLLAPQTDMIFGDGVGASLVANLVLFCVTLMRFAQLKKVSRPRGSVGIAALLCRWQTAGGGSIPRWSGSKTQDRRPAERQRARTKKKAQLKKVLGSGFNLLRVQLWTSVQRKRV